MDGENQPIGKAASTYPDRGRWPADDNFFFERHVAFHEASEVGLHNFPLSRFKLLVNPSDNRPT